MPTKRIISKALGGCLSGDGVDTGNSRQQALGRRKIAKFKDKKNSSSLRVAAASWNFNRTSKSHVPLRTSNFQGHFCLTHLSGGHDFKRAMSIPIRVGGRTFLTDPGTWIGESTFFNRSSLRIGTTTISPTSLMPTQICSNMFFVIYDAEYCPFSMIASEVMTIYFKVRYWKRQGSLA